MWHASVAMAGDWDRLRALTEEALKGRGDPEQEWHDCTHVTYHLRRRLTPEECELGGCLSVEDLRATGRGRRRLEVLFSELPRLRIVARTMGEA